MDSFTQQSDMKQCGDKKIDNSFQNQVSCSSSVSNQCSTAPQYLGFNHTLIWHYVKIKSLVYTLFAN